MNGDDLRLIIDQAFLINGRVSIDPWVLRELVETREIESSEHDVKVEELEEENDELRKVLRVIITAANDYAGIKPGVAWVAKEAAREKLLKAVEDAELL
jgi:hypothetical protein